MAKNGLLIGFILLLIATVFSAMRIGEQVVEDTEATFNHNVAVQKFQATLAVLSQESTSDLVAKYQHNPNILLFFNTIEDDQVDQANIPDFAKITDTRVKKVLFFAFIRNSIIEQNQLIQKQRDVLTAIRNTYLAKHRLSARQLTQFNKLVSRYHVNPELSFDERLNSLWHRVDIIPPRLVMVQAANESAWGTSRFAQQGLNLFGHWCYVKGCGMVPKRRSSNAIHEVRVYDSLSQAVKRYFYNLNTHKLYKAFRDIRYSLRQGKKPLSAIQLAFGLINYSTKREAYVHVLVQMIKHNEPYFGLPTASESLSVEGEQTEDTSS